MIDLNYLYGSFLFYSICKLVSYLGGSMHSKSKTILTSIPENENESDVDLAATKWVPKKKHEVLKAKYKCLKKLFQIYDASVIGILPESCGQGEGFSVEERDDGRKSRRKKRSHRTRADACAGTADLASEVSEPIQDDAATAVLRDLKIEYPETTTAETANTKLSNTTLESEFKQNSVTTSNDSYANACAHECHCGHTTPPLQQPTYYVSERRKPTRFQTFIQRLLGIRREPYRRVVLNGHILAASDNDINHRCVEKRRRRGLRCRRLRRPKNVQSEGALRDVPLLDYAQAVQRNCLLDTTPRQCPISGCRMMLYGIINYNDHLNMCHFPERRVLCRFCHEGFENDADKLQHEREHIGLSRLTPLLPAPTPRLAVTSDTQTDPQLTAAVQEEKLKKIVSFFDKIGDSDQILSDIKQNSSRYSESNLKPSSVEERSCATSFNRTASCVDTSSLCHKHNAARARADSDLFGVKCNFCGEKFDYRRQLSLHVDLEHRVHDKFSKFHSCVGMTSHQRPGQLTVTSAASTLGCPSTISQCCSDTSNLTTTSASKVSVVDSIVGRLKGINLKWEPGTKIIRV